MEKKNNEPFYGLIGLMAGIILICICVFVYSKPDDERRVIKEKVDYVYYNVPVYTTVYDIVYPDTTIRYTVVHHSQSRLSSHRGTNYLYSTKHDRSWADEYPDYWQEDWNKTEIDVSTTAPIRIVSETVECKKMKFKK